MAVQKVATQVIEDAAVTDAKLNTTGLGLHRNFIIDGDFTQWPEGTDQISVSSADYGPALWKIWLNGAAVMDMTRVTDVPTIDESGHQSTYAFEVDITTADASLAAGDYAWCQYNITGSDFTHLSEQEIVFNFWHKHTKTGTYSGSFRNSAGNRSYTFEYTQSTTETWEEATITATLDTSGTWLYTEADQGLIISLMVAAGSTWAGGTADSTWEDGNFTGSTNQVNGTDANTNFFRIAQVGLYLGSVAPTFSSPPVSTVKNQVDYYVEKRSYDSNTAQIVCGGYSDSTDKGRFEFEYSEKRRNPTISYSGVTHFGAIYGAGNVTTATNTQSLSICERSMMIYCTGMSGLTNGHGISMCQRGAQESWILIDARH